MSAPRSDNKDNQEQPQRRVTMKDIARELGISHVAVSLALGNKTGVSEETRRRVRAKAEELGYVTDPLLSVLSHYRISSKTKPIQAELAWINTWAEPQRLRQHHEFEQYWLGAVDCARRSGFELQAFNTSEFTLRRLQSILKNRSIKGVLIAPLEIKQANWTSETWKDFAAVRFGRTIPEPETYFVSSAQVNNTIHAYSRMHQLGYRRIGYIGEWMLFRYFGIGFAWAQQQYPESGQLPALPFPAQSNTQQKLKVLKKWLNQTKPDAILTDAEQMPQLLKTLGYRVPDDIGLATTSVHDTPIDAGIDQMPFEIGRTAVRTLISLLSQNLLGTPATRNETLVGGRWVDGSMLPPRT